MTSMNVKVSDKGYVVLPAKLRKEMSIKGGTRMLLIREEDKIILQPIHSFTEKLSGISGGSFGKTAKDIQEYIDREREDE
jgi:AbrB family looped-hinge helix DNA binding protein